MNIFIILCFNHHRLCPIVI